MVDGFLNTFLVDFKLAFLTFLKQPGAHFGAFWDHFGRLWLLVATFQAHLAPESRKLSVFEKNDAKIEAFLEPFWLPWAPLGSKVSPLDKKCGKSCSRLRFVDFVKISVFSW